MPGTREQIMNALVARLTALCGASFATYSRALQTWENLVSSIQNNGTVPDFPALYLFDGWGFGGGKDTWTRQGRGMPPTRTPADRCCSRSSNLSSRHLLQTMR
jgi:hypothetical protein